jgi:hypothetical protein
MNECGCDVLIVFFLGTIAVATTLILLTVVARAISQAWH